MKPATIGQPPPARYMHCMEYFEKSNIIIIAGGRNDQLQTEKVMSDIWILKLSNLEWQRALLGGRDYLKPRFNFASIILGTKLIIAGGIGHDFKFVQDYQEVELDQNLVQKTFKKRSKIEFLRNQS